MRKIMGITVVLFFALLLGCSPSVEKVKSGKLIIMGNYVPIQQLVDGLAGATGEVKWSSFDAEKNNKELKIVQVDIARNDKKAKIQFIYNPDRDVHELAYAEIDGKAASLFDLALKSMTGI